VRTEEQRNRLKQEERVKEITRGVLEERLKSKEVIDRGNKSKTQRRVRGKDSKEGQIEK
jgi:hypothetical protein